MRWTGLSIPGSFANELGRINLRYTIRRARFASNSAVKHLFTRTSTTADLYSVPNTGRSLPELRDGALAKLVKAGNYGAADQVRLHLIQEGKEIAHHPIYEQAAMLGLPWTVVDEQRLAHLEAWFSLIPRRHPTLQPLFETGADHFPVTRRFLFASPSERLSAILRLGIICATKGYVQPILKDTLPLIVRFAPEDVGTAWLRDMERAIVNYSPDSRTVPHKPHTSDAVNHFREISIKVCCQAGWLSYAMTLLESNPLSLTDRTRTLLAKSLRDAGRVEDALVVGRRPKIRDAWTQAAKLPSALEPPPPPRSMQYKATRRDVAMKVRYINSQLRKHQAPSISNVAAVCSSLRKVGGTSRIVTCLRQRALAAGEHCAMPWMEGELRSLDTGRHYDEILRLYLTHFDTDVQLPGFFPYTLTRIAAQHELIPTPTALPKCTLRKRWFLAKSIVRLVPTLPEPVATLHALYGSCRSEFPGNDEACQMSSAFMASFGDCGAPDDAVRVLKDSGKARYMKQLETLAGVLATAGRVAKAMALLRTIEAGGIQVTLQDGRVRCARARASTYICVIKGFVKAGLLQPAFMVEAMMNTKLGSVGRKRDIEVTEGLRALERQHDLTE